MAASYYLVDGVKILFLLFGHSEDSRIFFPVLIPLASLDEVVWWYLDAVFMTRGQWLHLALSICQCICESQAAAYDCSVLGLESWRSFPASLGEQVQRRGRLQSGFLRGLVRRPIFRSTTLIYNVLDSSSPCYMFCLSHRPCRPIIHNLSCVYLKSADFVRLLLRVRCRVVRTKKPLL